MCKTKVQWECSLFQNKQTKKGGLKSLLQLRLTSYLTELLFSGVQEVAGPGTEAEANFSQKTQRLQLCSLSQILTLKLQMLSSKMISPREL